jgi:hypothetical protein
LLLLLLLFRLLFFIVLTDFTAAALNALPFKKSISCQWLTFLIKPI